MIPRAMVKTTIKGELLDIYKEFNELLKVRLEKRIYTTEDSVRYTFFAAMLEKGGLKPEDFILELPHNRINRARIDTYIVEYNQQQMIIEFKYHRSIPSEKNSPRPQKAGQLFNDIRRLNAFHVKDPAIRLLIYLTDTEMVSYMKNKRNGLKDFFELAQTSDLRLNPEFFDERCHTLSKATKGRLYAKLRCEWNSSLPLDHELRVYQIFP
jgi:hypothetical protein